MPTNNNKGINKWHLKHQNPMTEEKNFGLIEDYLMSIQKSQN